MKKNLIIKNTSVLLVLIAFFGCTPEETEKLGTNYGTVTDFSSGNPIANVPQ